MIYTMNDELAAQILANMLENTREDIDKREGSPTYTVMAPISDELMNAYAELKAQEEADFPVNLQGEVSMTGYKLDLFAGIWTPRKKGEPAKGTVFLTAAEPITVPVGTQVFAPASLNIIFETTSEVTATPSGVSVPVTAVQIGSEGNVSSGAITGVIGDLEGVITVTNPTEMSGGIDDESDQEYVQRFLNLLRKTPTSGNANHYWQWATEVSGIVDAYVIPVWNGNNTVKVVVLSSNYDAPTSEKVQEVSNYIESVRPIFGGMVTVEAAVEIPISITAMVQATASVEDIQAPFEEAVKEYLKSLKFTEEDTVRIVRLQNALLDIEGVVDITNFTVNGGTGNTVIPAGSVAVLQGVTLNVQP